MLIHPSRLIQDSLPLSLVVPRALVDNPHASILAPFIAGGRCIQFLGNHVKIKDNYK